MHEAYLTRLISVLLEQIKAWWSLVLQILASLEFSDKGACVSTASVQISL